MTGLLPQTLTNGTNGTNGTHELSQWYNETNSSTQSTRLDTDTGSGFISEDLAEDLSFAFECVTMPILVAFGTTGNILSLVVLSHRKLRRSSTTILLIGLALSDCLYLLTTMVRQSTCIISRFDKLLSYRYFVLSFSAVYYINTCFSRTSTLLVAVMSMERLLAVTLPLKVKLLCTKARMAGAVFAVFLFTFTFLVLLPMQYDVKYRGETPYLKTNAFYVENQEFVDVYNRYITVAVLRWLPKVIVVMCNGIIIVKLWRRRVPSANAENPLAVSNQSNQSKTQRRITQMLVTVAIVFVVALLPGDAFWIATIVVEEFALYGKYNNLFTVLSDVTLTFEIINSSVNFVIYMVLNSTFADVYQQLFCPCLSKAKRSLRGIRSSEISVTQSLTSKRNQLEDNVSTVSGTGTGSAFASRDTLCSI